MSAKRHFPPFVIRLWFHELKNSGELSADKLARILQTKFSKSDALKIVQHAISDDVLVYSTLNKKKGLRLQNNFDGITEHDFYCYECHLPGQLVNCTNCLRAFHRTCYRKKPRRPNNISHLMQENKVPNYDSDSDDSTNQTSTPPSAVEVINEIRDAPININMTPLLVEQENEGKPTLSDLIEEKAEVIYVSEKPPPRRRRAHSYKWEQKHADSDNADVVDETQLCTACRLLKTELYNAPLRGVEELNFLIDCCFETHRSWMKTDVTKYIQGSGWSEDDAILIQRLLFAMKEIGLDGIAEKIRLQQYKFFTEFLIDLLDFQHNVCVFFGDDSTAAEESKYLLNDITYELEEIRRCPDCFRYSNEKSKFWFCKPCVPRHELVYAKARGFPYWPAKVIRMLHRYNKYDVRFFGEEHSRALIPINLTKSIDTDITSLKIRKTVKFKEALQELECFQRLSRYSPGTDFSFYADQAVVEGIIQFELGSYMPASRINDEELLTTPTPLVPAILPASRRTRRYKSLMVDRMEAPVTLSTVASSLSNDLQSCGAKRNRRCKTLTQASNSIQLRSKVKKTTNTQTINSHSPTAISKSTRQTRSSKAVCTCTCDTYKSLLHDLQSVQHVLAVKKMEVEMLESTNHKLKSLNEVQHQEIRKLRSLLTKFKRRK